MPTHPLLHNPGENTGTCSSTIIYSHDCIQNVPDIAVRAMHVTNTGTTNLKLLIEKFNLELMFLNLRFTLGEAVGE